MSKIKILLVAFSLFTTLSWADSCEYFSTPCCQTQCFYSSPGSPFFKYRIKEDKSSQSFMLFHPIFEQTAIRQSLWHNFAYNKTNCQTSAFQVIALYEQSTDSNKTANYFLPYLRCDNDPVRFVAGDNAGINSEDNERIHRERDIRAEWLGLPSDFSGYFSINPQRRASGFLLEYHTDLQQYWDIAFLEGYWLGVAIPVIGAENRLNLCQNNIKNPGSTFPHDIVEAFCQPCWNFAKVCGTRSSIGVADIEIRAGRAYCSKDYFQLVYYSGLSIPASPRQNAEYLFDSYLGYNGHFGFTVGLNAQIPLNCDTSCYAICFFANIDSIFLLHNKQCRTFDLRCKPWSRYMNFVRKNGSPDMICPGVNVLSLKMRCNPYNLTDFSCGWRVISRNLEFELGYSVWGHGDERLEYIKNWDEALGYHEWGIAGTQDPNSATAITASQSTISCLAPNDTEFTPITQCDIDLNSGRARSAINHKAHFSVGALHEGVNVNAFFGGGTFYEMAQENTALSRWGFWVKCGAIF